MINDAGTGTDDLWSASKIASAISAGAGSMTYPAIGNFGYTANGTTWASMGFDTDLATVSASDDTVPSAKAVKTALNAVSVAAPTVQSADPTSASAQGWYCATGSGDCFYKSASGLFTLPGSYTADPTTYTLTLDIIDGNATDKVTVNSTDRTTDGTWTGLSSATQAVTATADTGRTASCTGTGITGSYPDYVADMTQDRSIACTFSSSGITDNFNRTDGAIGSNYTAINGSLTIASNKAIGSAWAGKWMHHNTSTGSNDHYAQATVFPGVSSSSDGSGVIVRSNGTTGYMVQLYAGTPGAIILYPFNGSSVAAHVGANIDVNITDAPHVLKLSVSGSTFTVWLDGVSQGTWTDSTYSSGQYIGISSRSAGTELSVDDFSGGL